MLSPDVRLPSPIRAVVVGASAGAIDALAAILPRLPAETPWPVIVVVHIPANQRSRLDEIFARRCALPCAQPEDRQPIEPGIWFAPPDYHLLVDRDRCFALSIEEPVNYSRPSIDVLFECAADVYGEGLVCVVLTGANHDGARGARIVRDAGGFVIVQDPTTAEAASMPNEAIASASPQLVATLEVIAELLHHDVLEGTSA